eukprot:gb/GFBE01027036.1/.p1 GENE.gb/GFBE01027036.1/~~gb/GFBE01027036.1/.p1  ORF type:complete len:285 (+),score=68.37 gb/GFBE01027036.1/:1-855(+)
MSSSSRPSARRRWPAMSCALCLSALQFALQSGRGFVSPPRLRGLIRRGLQLSAGPEAGDEDPAKLLAQAEALRREAALEEAAMKAGRSQRQPEVEQIENKVEDPLLAEALAKIAEARERQRRQAAGEPPQEPEVQEPQTGTSASSSKKLEDLDIKFPRKVMTKAEWEDMAQQFKDMNLIEQFQTNQKLGPQGRRKLAALREGKTGGTFILPGERVRLLKEEKSFRAAFKRFEGDALNGYSAAKWARRGEECVVKTTYNDKTMTCVFADEATMDFPFEVVDGYTE